MSKGRSLTVSELILWSLTVLLALKGHTLPAAAAKNSPFTSSSTSPKSSPGISPSPYVPSTSKSPASKAEASPKSEKPKVVSTLGRKGQDVAGPVVRAAIADRVEELAANLTAEGEIPTKKSIAQMIDEALEQEFPEEKRETIGKNYNETAKSSDVSSSHTLFDL